MTNDLVTKTSYFERNRRWAMPLAATCVIAMTPLILATLGDAQAVGGKSDLVPAWMTSAGKFGLIMGGLATGFGATFTDTLSGRLVRVAIPGIAVGVALAAAGVSGLQLFGGMVVAWAVMGLFIKPTR